MLPITASGSEAAKVLQGKHLNSKKLKQLYFLGDEFDDEVKKNKQFEKLVIYSGSNATSVASSFAHNFGEESSNFRGKRISGDDLFLNTALVKDPLGVSFNALPNIFDLQSRHLKSDLALVGPLGRQMPSLQVSAPVQDVRLLRMTGSSSNNPNDLKNW